MLGLRYCVGFSLVAESEGSSRVAVPGLLWWLLLLCSRGSKAHGLRSLAAAGGLSVVAPRLQSTGSVVVAHRLSCSVACGIFPDQGLNPSLPHWQVDFLSLSHQGSLRPLYLITDHDFSPVPRS